jgi:hypothetical protein
MALQKIPMDTPLQAGDHIQIKLVPRISLGNTLNAYVIAGNIAKITSSHPEFTITSWTNTDDGGVTLNIIVNDQIVQRVAEAGIVTPAVIIATVIGISIIFLSVTAWKVSDTITETIDTPGGQAIAYSVPIAAIALLLFGLYFYFKKK